MAPADPEYRAFSSRRATEILVPPGAKSGRKAVAKLSDCAQRGLHTHPRRTNSKLRQTRRTRQAVAPDSESNTKGSVPCGLRGQRGRLSAPPPKYRTGRRDSESPPLPTIFVAGAPRAQSMTRTAFFFVENRSRDADPPISGNPGKLRFWESEVFGREWWCAAILLSDQSDGIYCDDLVAVPRRHDAICCGQQTGGSLARFITFAGGLAWTPGEGAGM
jgi:hypothetical protein